MSGRPYTDHSCCPHSGLKPEVKAHWHFADEDEQPQQQCKQGFGKFPRSLRKFDNGRGFAGTGGSAAIGSQPPPGLAWHQGGRAIEGSTRMEGRLRRPPWEG